MANTLTDREKRALRFRGWTNTDLADLDDEQAAALLASKAAKPGSRKAAAAVAAVGHGGLPDRYTDEGEAARIAGKDTASAYVIRSDHEGDLLARAALRKLGSGVPIPTDEIAAPYVEANPDRAFRWMTKEQCAKRGTRGYQPVYDKNGKKVTHLNENRYLAHKPRDVRDAQLREYAAAGQRNSAAAREAMDSTVERMAKDNAGTGRIGALDKTHPIFNRG